MKHGNCNALLGNKNAKKSLKQTEKIHFSISLDEKALWQERAKVKGITLAKLIRQYVNRGIEDENAKCLHNGDSYNG